MAPERKKDVRYKELLQVAISSDHTYLLTRVLFSLVHAEMTTLKEMHSDWELAYLETELGPYVLIGNGRNDMCRQNLLLPDDPTF